MCAHAVAEPRSAVSRIEGPLTWLGGGHWRQLGERHEQSAHAVAGAVVLFGAVLAWLVASLAVSQSAGWPVPGIVGLALVFGVLVGAVVRGTVSGPSPARLGIAARAAVAIAVGVVVGELAALVVFASSIDHHLDQVALRNSDSVPAVAQASETLRQTRDARAALDAAVEQAREHQDKALVVARCEYNPTPACPQTRITGIPGPGPEARTANELLADAQRELDVALAARDRLAPELDARIAHDERALAEERHGVVANAGRGLGARWVAMNEVTFAGTGALLLRLLTSAFSALVYLLPLLLGLWRGETTHDRHAVARAERERAELEADTAVAIKRAEVRREAEMMWAEHQLTQARLAIAAQTEIDREHQRRRVVEAIEGPVRAPSQRTFEPVQEDIYLPIAAEAEAASLAVAQLPAAVEEPPGAPVENLPVQVEPSAELQPHEERGTPLIPSIPDATKAAARWIRPLVPPFVARVIDTTTQPLRTARQVYEEVEEITFALKRTRKVTVDTVDSVDSKSSETGGRRDQAPPGRTRGPADRIESSRHGRSGGAAAGNALDSGGERQSSLRPGASQDSDGLALGPGEGTDQHELTQRQGPPELRPPEGPRELPPGS